MHKKAKRGGGKTQVPPGEMTRGKKATKKEKVSTFGKLATLTSTLFPAVEE